MCRVHVDFDHARVGRDFDVAQAMIVRRRIAFDDDRHLQLGRRGFDGGDQVEIIFQSAESAA